MIDQQPSQAQAVAEGGHNNGSAISLREMADPLLWLPNTEVEIWDKNNTVHGKSYSDEKNGSTGTCGEIEKGCYRFFKKIAKTAHGQSPAYRAALQNEATIPRRVTRRQRSAQMVTFAATSRRFLDIPTSQKTIIKKKCGTQIIFCGHLTRRK